ncbi:MAG TPA: hypothetical protein DEP87_04565 [Candidatus Pacebacteria bacterium]|nr:hypothetical protein [Candidatus Paceibacterota bacterium]
MEDLSRSKFPGKERSERALRHLALDLFHDLAPKLLSAQDYQTWQNINSKKSGFVLEEAFIYYQYTKKLPDAGWLRWLGEEVIDAETVLLKAFKIQDQIYLSGGEGADSSQQF